MIDLTDRVALVTGAGQGLGRAHALALAGRGAAVVVNDVGRTEDGASTAEAVVDEIRWAGGRAISDRSDISTADGAAALVAAAIAEFGRLDILICNAGIVRDTSFVKMTQDQWDAVLSVHLGGTYQVIRAAWSGLRAQGYGRVVVTTSASGLYGSFGQANYSAAKTALLGLMNTLSIEGAKNDIRVNAISPVATTAMTEALMTPQMREALDPGYVSPAVVYLASQECRLSSAILHVRGDEYAAVQLFQSKPVSFGRKPTPEEFESSLETLLDFTDSVPGAEAWANRVR
ncbi:SDR family NAD(P)-dependent oxidoreductase [Nakamurella sp. YIM 132087]|uniref:SDR family NAD(P)-dependent oxidoreductase n=1 Tax=Nakamurella alba TaxID=2665158 RepID=A0A7K1FIZ0_9ACTN|nr:SDR family NAD(P)-dependent oxidoreductase [Nakamurella alba]MTD14040.1 SDR family NAD(P)-dependent oxidoreductase [Nakamurella alba]